MVGVALALATLTSPTSARACYYGGCGDVAVVLVPAAVGGALVGLATLGVLGQDLSLAVRGRAQPTDLAIINLVLGLLDLAGGLALAVLGSDGLAGFGAGLIGAGSIMVTDGTVALALDPGEPRSTSLGLAVGPHQEGAVVSVNVHF